jgi:cell division protease FtsH
MPAAVPPRSGRGPTPPPGGTDSKISRRMLLALPLMLAAMWLWKSTVEGRAQPPIAYSQLYDWIKAGKVQSIVIAGDSVDATLKSPEKLDGRTVKTFHTSMPPNDPAFLPLLREKGVAITVKSQKQPFAVEMLMTLLPWALIIGAWVWMSRRARSMLSTGGPLGGFLKSPGRKFDKTASVKVTFEDIAGLKAAKADLQEIVQFLKEPDRFRRLGGKVPRGVLLVGPPGTGKTLLARAVAGESGVPFFSISASEFIELFIGLGAARVRDLFTEAKKSAPAIILIDEIDAVGRSRGAGLGGGNDEREQTLNQLLSEMDGFDRSDLVVVIAATNRPDVLDPALLRPGRFDRHVTLDRPDIRGRRQILDVHARNKPLEAAVDLDVLARQTPGFSGADLANLINEAALLAARRGKRLVAMKEFEEAKDKVMMGTERKSMVMTEDEKRMTAYHEAGHAIVALHEPASDPIHKATIIPRGRALGMVMRLPERDSYSYHRDKMYANLAVSMGGRVAEEVIFGYDKVSSGASSDIQYATQLARDMVTRWGMSDALGPLQYADPDEEVFLGYSVNRTRQMSNETAQAIDKEIRKVVEDGYARAKHLLDENRGELESLAQALLEYETLSGDEIKKVIAGESIDRGGSKGPSLPAAGSSIPKAKRPKAGAIGGPATAGV